MTVYSGEAKPKLIQRSKNFNFPRSKPKAWCSFAKGKVFRDHCELSGSCKLIGSHSIRSLG